MNNAELRSRFYGLLDELARRTDGPRRLADCHGRMDWPRRGVYFFFEDGETRQSNGQPRVVRIGTHALRPSSSTLWGRLAQHRGQVAGRSAGGGNHRASVFRLHVGSALLRSGRFTEPVPTWGQRSSASREVRAAERELERAVSQHIGAMPFLWLDVDDPPSADSDRGVIEQGSIGLLSRACFPDADTASPGWLGSHSDREAIRTSCLWNVNHIHEEPQGDYLDVLERWVTRS